MDSSGEFTYKQQLQFHVLLDWTDTFETSYN